jgi:hypothetical protein
MKRIAIRFVYTLPVALILALATVTSAAKQGMSERPDAFGQFPINGHPVAGLWATTGFLDPALAPDLEGGPLLQGLLLIHANGTVEWDTTAASGLHPGFPFARGAPSIYGTWSVVDNGIRIETFNYTPGITGEGELGRQTWALDFPAADGSITGEIVADVLPCQAGLLRCPNPVDVGPVEFPEDDEGGPPVSPVQLKRLASPKP